MLYGDKCAYEYRCIHCSVWVQMIMYVCLSTICIQVEICKIGLCSIIVVVAFITHMIVTADSIF